MLQTHLKRLTDGSSDRYLLVTFLQKGAIFESLLLLLRALYKSDLSSRSSALLERFYKVVCPGLSYIIRARPWVRKE